MEKITDSFDHSFKLITLGSANTGKTCLLARYFRNVFEKTAPTLTVDFFTKSLVVDGRNVLVTAYDTAGSENYRSLTQRYVRDKHCLLLVFDLSLRSSFLELEDWLRWAEQLRRPDALLVLVGTKKDRVEERQVDSSEALEWAGERGMAYFEVSALD